MKIKRRIIGYIDIGQEAGFALIIVMVVLLMMTILGLNSIMTSTTDIQIASNERVAAKALFIADAGLNHTMRKLRGQDFDTLLTTATNANDGFVPLDFDPGASIVDTISFDGGTYSISIRNNHMSSDSPQQTTYDTTIANNSIYKDDNDGYIIMRSRSTYNGVTKTIEANIRRIAADFPIVGGLSISGALAEIDIDGNAFSITGNNTTPSGWTPSTTCGAHSGIALGDCTSRCVIIGCAPSDPCYVSSSHTLTSQELNNISNSSGQSGQNAVDVATDLQGQTTTIQAQVDLLIPYADRTINIGENTTMNNINWGTYDNPQVTVVNFTDPDNERELRIQGTSTGYGILIINSSGSTRGGEFDLRGNFTWYGIIIFTNYSEAELGAGGNIQIYGSMLFTNTADGETDNEVEIEGNTDIYYSCAAEQKAKNYSALVVNSWREVGS